MRLPWSQDEYEKKNVAELNEKELDRRLTKIIITPESKSEYEKRVNYETKAVVFGDGIIKGVSFHKTCNSNLKCWVSLEIKKQLVEAGIEAIVDANYSMAFQTTGIPCENYFGLPVARKK